MGAQELHLVRQHAAALQIDVLGVGRNERDREQLHPGPLGSPAGLLVVAPLAGGDHVLPLVRPAQAQGTDMVAGQLAALERVAAVQAQPGIALEQGRVVQRRRVGVAQQVVAAVGRDNGVEGEDGAPTGDGVVPAAHAQDVLPADIGHLSRIMQANGLLVPDPLQRHSGDVGAEDLLRQDIQHGHIPLSGATL